VALPLNFLPCPDLLNRDWFLLDYRTYKNFSFEILTSVRMLLSDVKSYDEHHMDRQLQIDTFPTEGLIAALAEWWDAEISKREADPFSVSGTLYDVVLEIDSLSTLSALLVIEKLVGFEIPVSVVKPGGYQDCQEMIDHLVPEIHVLFEKRHHSTITPMQTHSRYAY
jgi:hypothetical protein